MSSPWMTGQGKTDADSHGVDTSSSHSLLLHSIYGSQASQLLSAMSSQLVIEEESEEELSEDEYVPSMSKVSSRPKSTPASAIAARQKLQRPQTASVSSTARRQSSVEPDTSSIISNVMRSCSTRRLSRPASAKPQLQSYDSSRPARKSRPSSASVKSSYSSLASSSGVTKPVQGGTQRRTARPKSAFVSSSRSVPTLDYNHTQEEPVTGSHAPLPTTMMVHRTSAPEYLNFWEGKPLSERGGGIVIHERKQWKRPKSDYGSRYYTRTNSAGSKKNSNSLTKVVEAWGEGDGDQKGGKGDDDTGGLAGQGDLMKDLLSGSLHSSDNDKYKKRDTSEDSRNRQAYRSGAHSDSRYGKTIVEEEDEGIDDDYFQKNEDDDKLPEIPSSTSITSSLSGTDLVNDLSTCDLDASPKTVINDVRMHDKKPKEESGLLPPIVLAKPPEKPTTPDTTVLIEFNQYTLYDSDDEYDKKISMDWLNSRLALTKHSTRFELPLDLTRLEGLTPVKYLQTYCVITERRAVHYSKVFNKFLKYGKQELSIADLIPALLDVHFSTVEKEQIECVVKIVDIPSEMTNISLRLFAGMSALAERMLRQSTLPSTTVLSEYGQRREIVEDADFEALEWKLRGCKITDSLRNLFAQL